MTSPRRLIARSDVKIDYDMKGIHLEDLGKEETQMFSQKNAILEVLMK